MRRFFIAALLVVSSVWATSSQAAFTVCNKASAPVSVAIAYETPQDVLSQGWWTVEAGKCDAVISAPLTQKILYHYEMSTPLNLEWAGTYNFCTQAAPQFRIMGNMDCETRNYKTTGFRQVELNGMTDYTLDVVGPAPVVAPVAAPAIASPVAAPVMSPPAETAPVMVPPVSSPVASPVAAPQVTTPAPSPALGQNAAH